MRTVETGDTQDVSASADSISTQTSTPPVRVRVLKSVPEIEEIRDFWSRMQRHPNADIDFYLKVLPSLPGLVRPHVMIAQRDATPVAILVGRLENTRMDLKLGYADFWRPRVRALTFIYGGLLGSPCSEVCDVLARQIMTSLRQGEADIAFFNHLRADSVLYSALRSLAGLLYRDYFPTLQIHRKMTIPSCADEFWQHFSPKVRKNQQWQARKFVSKYSGNVRIRHFRNGDELERMVQDVEQVAKKTYQRGLGVGFIDGAAMRNRLHLQAQRGVLRGYILYVENRPCAFWLGTAYGEEFHSDFMGYDPIYGRYSPGMYLIMKVIEDFSNSTGRDREVCAIDFGLGDAQYKEILGSMQWEDVSFHLFGSTLRGVGLQAARTPLLLIDRVARAMLGQSRWLPKIKRVWRRQVAPSVSSSS